MKQAGNWLDQPAPRWLRAVVLVEYLGATALAGAVALFLLLRTEHLVAGVVLAGCAVELARQARRWL